MAILFQPNFLKTIPTLGSIHMYPASNNYEKVKVLSFAEYKPDIVILYSRDVHKLSISCLW